MTHPFFLSGSAGRRRFLASSAGLGALAIAAPALRGVRADAHSEAGAMAPTYTRTVGDLEITTILDGYIPFEFGVFRGIEQAEYDEELRNDFIDPGKPLNVGITAHLVREGNRLMLIDAGAAGAFGPTAGRLQSALAGLGVDMTSITDLLITHLHPDHVAGAMVDSQAAFPNAALHVNRTEVEFWTSESNRTAAPDSAKGFFDLAASAIAAYGERVNRFDGETDLMSGVSTHPMPGHTLGHTGYRLSSGDAQLLVWGDMTAIAPVQFERPSVGIVYDTDSDMAAETRRRVLDMVATDRLLVAGTHLPYPAYGHVEAAGDAYRWVPDQWQYAG